MSWANVKNAVGRAVFPRKSVGKKVMRVPGTFRKKNDKIVPIAAAWMEWIVENIKSNDYRSLKIISCEFDDIDLIKSAIQKRFKIEIICSNSNFYSQLSKFLSSSDSKLQNEDNGQIKSDEVMEFPNVVIYRP